MLPPLWMMLAALAVYLLIAAGWVAWGLLALRQSRSGTRNPWANLPLQLSVLAFVGVALRWGPLFGLAAAAAPPVSLVALLELPWPSPTLQIALIALPLAAITLALCLRLPVLRPFSAGSTGLSLLLGALLVGEVQSRRAMCATAAAQGLSSVTRHSFAWSVANSGQDHQSEIHALAQRGEERFGWSYARMDWSSLPDTIWPNVSSGRPACR